MNDLEEKGFKALNVNDNCFDVIRLICTFTVFFGHFITHFSINNSILIEIAYFIRGVPVFFFLSGFFIARSLEKYSTRDFLIRRMIRIFPELWVCVIINLVFILISMKGKYDSKDILVYLGTQLSIFQFYTGDWLRGYGVGTPNGALWTITVDIQFYIVAILLAKLLKKRKIQSWGIVILMMMVVNLALEKTKNYIPELVYKLLQCNLIPFIWIFLIGMCVYYNRDKLIGFFVKTKWIFILIYIIWQYVMPKEMIRLFEGIRYNLVTTLLMLGMIIGIGFSKSYRLKHDYSYSFYLYHMVTINLIIHHFCNKISDVGTFLLIFILSGGITALFAIISNRFIAGSLTNKIEEILVIK